MSRGSQFTEEFKREAVRKAETSQNVSRTARELGISNKTLHDWLKVFGRPQQLDLNTATMSELSARVRQLERAVAEKEATIAVLKKLSRLSARQRGAICHD